MRIERRAARAISPTGVPVIVAGGPLVGGGLARAAARAVRRPLLLLRRDRAHRRSRVHRLGARLPRLALRQRGSDDGGDYVNCPLTRDEYRAFVDAVRAGSKVPPHAFEEPRYFEGCLPIEVMAERGDDVLAFGPMKPVGLDDRRATRWCSCAPRTAGPPATTWSASRRGSPTPSRSASSRMIPALRERRVPALRIDPPQLVHRVVAPARRRARAARAARTCGSPGRSPASRATSSRRRWACWPRCFVAGRLAAGRWRRRRRRPRSARSTITSRGRAPAGEPFAPTNINFGLLPPLEGRAKKRERRALHAERATAALGPWLSAVA